MGNNRQNTLFLDGLRGTAVLLVVLCHAGYILFDNEWAIAGCAGVDIFFVLSSFLLTHILYDKMASLGCRPHYLDVIKELIIYAIRRFLRVYPLMMIMTLMSLWIPSMELTNTRIPLTLEQVLQTWKLQDLDFGHLWTIAIEVKHFVYVVY